MAAVYPNSSHLDSAHMKYPLSSGSPNTYPGPGGFIPIPSPRLSPNHQMDFGAGPGPMPSPMGTGISNQMMGSQHLSPYPSGGGRSFDSESDDESSRSSRSPPLTGAMSGSRARSGLRSHSAHRKVGFGLPPDYIPTSKPRPRGLAELTSRARSLTPPPLSPRGSAVRRRLHGETHPSHHLTDTLRPPAPYPAYGNSTSLHESSQGSAESYSRRRSSPYAASPYGPTSIQPESIPAGTTITPHSAYPSQPISRHDGRVRSRAHSQSHASSNPSSRHRHGHHHHRHHHRDRDSPPSDSVSRPSNHRRRSRSLPPAIQAQPQIYHVQVPPAPQPAVHYLPPNPVHYPHHNSSQGRRRTRSSSHTRPPPIQIYAPPYNNQTHHASLPHSTAGSWTTAPHQGSQTRPPHTGFISSLLKSLNINKEDDHSSGAGYGMAAGHNQAPPKSRKKEKGQRSSGQYQQYPQMTTMPMYTGGHGGGYGYGGQQPLYVQGLPEARRRDRRMSF
ncbi:hypothetical protein CPB83DRAFT_861998 [Crepidotus variabilis]|uniref:Uncharacterized protein n=1 Tax=Crepidotus variabilis TaxID=179855 RepID=A0A9P6JKP3_9AGAR|nr:hypothetical protein CPB83DRAFT_861998 [Crepidotus variabilis]